MSGAALWAADPHQFGTGKIHVVDNEQSEQTLCGKWLSATPGNFAKSGRATCKNCLNAIENRADRKRREEEYRAESEQRAAERESELRQRREQYNAYLRSDSWKRRREKVLRRAGGTCEACLERPAVQVHHVTYEHIFNEPCFELRAVCIQCHDAITELDRARRVQP